MRDTPEIIYWNNYHVIIECMYLYFFILLLLLLIQLVLHFVVFFFFFFLTHFSLSIFSSEQIFRSRASSDHFHGNNCTIFTALYLMDLDTRSTVHLAFMNESNNPINTHFAFYSIFTIFSYTQTVNKISCDFVFACVQWINFLLSTHPTIVSTVLHLSYLVKINRFISQKSLLLYILHFFLRIPLVLCILHP